MVDFYVLWFILFLFLEAVRKDDCQNLCLSCTRVRALILSLENSAKQGVYACTWCVAYYGDVSQGSRRVVSSVWREMCLESSNYLLFSLKGCFCFYLDVFTEN